MRAASSAAKSSLPPGLAGACHQQPDVNYIQVLEKVDFPCTVHAQCVPFKGNQLRAETESIVHLWLLVVGVMQFVSNPVSWFRPSYVHGSDWLTSVPRDLSCFARTKKYLNIRFWSRERGALRARPQSPSCRLAWPAPGRDAEREFFIDNLLVRIHLIIVMNLVDRPCAMGV